MMRFPELFFTARQITEGLARGASLMNGWREVHNHDGALYRVNIINGTRDATRDGPATQADRDWVAFGLLPPNTSRVAQRERAA